MPSQLFVSVQVEFAETLGPAPGRYLLRSSPDADPERVLVVQGPGRGEEPLTRLTLIDPVPVAAEQQARAWLEDLTRDCAAAVAEALALVNRVLYLHRLAAADASVHEIAAADAAAIRAGWGSGEQLADGRMAHAVELQVGAGAPRASALLQRLSRRAKLSGIAEQERLAALLGGRTRPLLCEELALRARADLDAGRPRLATLELHNALCACVSELGAEGRQELALRVDELDSLRERVAAQAQAVLAGADGQPDGELLAHALMRLQSALRARAAAGVRLS